MSKIPETIKPLFHDYLKYMEQRFQNDILVGTYLYGSISLSGFDECKSDIDFVTVLKRELNQKEAHTLKLIHKELNIHSLGRRMDGIYIPMDGVGKSNEELPPYFYCSNGKVKKGYWDVNAVTWWMIEQYGIKVYGNEVSDLNIQSQWNKVIENMEYSINSYWINKAKNVIIFMFDDMVEFCILTISRILSTLEGKKILTKTEGANKAQDILPERWHLLLKEGLRLRNNRKSSSLYPSKFKRAKECREFIAFSHDLCNEKYFKELKTEIN
ncbi:aminoglycoside adenylyltransferase domain-containing protein [Priestia filamentosa]|uniref:aminoglycoside adenylyltransferase domain-containing protein n=1 Tax=Priestia filamentosa TaxID=1402861 RepID=UPI0009ECCC1B|nr:aminoglycoside adenylyltransferase domain-containing protein [Priestia filamentosa]